MSAPRCKVRTCADVERERLGRAIYIAPTKRETHAEFMARIAPRFDIRTDGALRTELETAMYWRLRELMA